MCVIPGVGGVLPRDGSAPACPPAPRFPLDEPFVPYSLEGLVWFYDREVVKDHTWKMFGFVLSYPTCMRMLSSLAGLGMKPTSQPSLTSRPIHQLLSYFSLMCRNSRISNETAPPCTGESSSMAPSYATLVRTANATGLLWNYRVLQGWIFIFRMNNTLTLALSNWLKAWRSFSRRSDSFSSSSDRSDDGCE